MNAELIAPIVTGVGVLCFCIIFTILYRSYASSTIAECESGKVDVELIDETIITNKKNSKLYRRIFRRVKQVLTIALIALLIPLMSMAIYSKITSGVAMIGGKGVIAVASPSMSMKNEANPYLAGINNQFNTFDLITLEKVDSPADLDLYDVIVFTNDEGTNIIHRIVGFQQTSTGVRYVTRGDSNNTNDDYRPCFDDVIGEYSNTRIPYVGAFIMFLQSLSGIITIAAVIYCLIMIESTASKMFIAREMRIDLLQRSIDFKTETVRDDELDSKFIETVYFKNYAYTFDENGFVSKTLVPERSDAQDLNSVPNDSEKNENA